MIVRVRPPTYKPEANPRDTRIIIRKIEQVCAPKFFAYA
jgi:hypothetical protein